MKIPNKFKVTQKHIDCGHKQNTETCPLTLAIRSMEHPQIHYNNASVSHYSASISIKSKNLLPTTNYYDYQALKNYIKRYENLMLFRSHPSVASFIYRFDNYGKDFVKTGTLKFNLIYKSLIYEENNIIRIPITPDNIQRSKYINDERINPLILALYEDIQKNHRFKIITEPCLTDKEHGVLCLYTRQPQKKVIHNLSNMYFGKTKERIWDAKTIEEPQTLNIDPTFKDYWITTNNPHPPDHKNHNIW